MISDIITKAIEESQLSKTQFAKELEINKSFLLRVISGEKLLSKNLFDKMFQADFITSETKLALQTEFYNQKYGTENAESINYFIKRINNFTNDINSRTSVYAREAFLEKALFSESFCYSTINEPETCEAISFLIKRCVKKEKFRIYTNFSPSHKRLSDIIYSALADGNISDDSEIIHITDLDSVNISEVTDFLFDSLRFSGIGINTYYRCSVHNGLTDAFPYYIITDDFIIRFTRNCDSMLVISDKSAVELYIERFKYIVPEYLPIAEFIQDEIAPFNSGMLTSHTLETDIDGGTCIMQFTSSELLDEVFHEEVPDRSFLVNAVPTYFQYVFSKRPRQYMTKESLSRFAETGELEVVSDRYVKPLSVESRKKIFERFRENPDNIFIIDKSKINISEKLNIHFYDNGIGFALYPTKKDLNLYMINLFFDYKLSSALQTTLHNMLEYIDNSDLYFGKEYVYVTLDEMIAKCNNRQNN